MVNDDDRLIKIPEGRDVDNTLLVKAYLVETELLLAGADAGLDYTVLDCFKLAIELDRNNSLAKISSELEDVNVYLSKIDTTS